jgi:predicted lipoprotein with Yx(FWY)xxD motif
MKAALRTLSFMTIASVVACNVPEKVCAGIGAPDVAVTVLDSVSGASAAAGATLFTYDLDAGGARLDSIVGQSDTEVLQGNEHIGRLSVVVRKSGYRDWLASEVLVRNGCPSIHTVALTARLARP